MNMTMEDTYNNEDCYIHNTVTETATIDHVSKQYDGIIQDDNVSHDFNELVDFTKVDNFDFGYDQTNMLVSLFLKLKTYKKYLGTCVIVNSDLSKGMTHMFDVVWEQKDLDFGVFNSKEDALSFIKSNIT